MTLRALLPFAAALFAGLIATGCASDAETEFGGDDEAVGEAEAELTRDAVCTVRNIQSEECKLIRFFTAASVEGERREIVARAFRWVEEGVKYSTSRNHTNEYGSYRRDCSGFVSMAWQLGQSLSTRNMAPFNGDVSYELSDYAELLPGDALNRRRPRRGNYHVALFAGWANPERTEFYMLHELSSGNPAMLTRHYWTVLGEYAPIRRHGL